jgi:hypothetical protein
MELISCFECGALTDGYCGATSDSHREWHEKLALRLQAIEDKIGMYNG